MICLICVCLGVVLGRKGLHATVRAARRGYVQVLAAATIDMHMRGLSAFLTESSSASPTVVTRWLLNGFGSTVSCNTLRAGLVAMHYRPTDDLNRLSLLYYVNVADWSHIQ